MNGRIVVFAKAPRPGFVKTRMTPPLSPECAAALYAAMLDDVLELTAVAAESLGLEPILALTPEAAVFEWEQKLPRVFRCAPQRGLDLAERLQNAVADWGEEGVPLLLRGSDSPALSKHKLAQALSVLADVDCVFCPDHDGGYNLVGLRRRVPQIFAVPTSRPTVLRETQAVARRLGLRVAQLSAEFDLDTPRDFLQLLQLRASKGEAPCPRTLTFLDKNNLWQFSHEERLPSPASGHFEGSCTAKG